MWNTPKWTGYIEPEVRLGGLLYWGDIDYLGLKSWESCGWSTVSYLSMVSCGYNNPKWTSAVTNWRDITHDAKISHFLMVFLLNPLGSSSLPRFRQGGSHRPHPDDPQKYSHASRTFFCSYVYMYKYIVSYMIDVSDILYRYTNHIFYWYNLNHLYIISLVLCVCVYIYTLYIRNYR